jgi:hypothetical protein
MLESQGGRDFEIERIRDPIYIPDFNVPFLETSAKEINSTHLRAHLRLVLLFLPAHTNGMKPKGS